MALNIQVWLLHKLAAAGIGMRELYLYCTYNQQKVFKVALFDFCATVLSFKTNKKMELLTIKLRKGMMLI